jgi:hypothetical protein
MELPSTAWLDLFHTVAGGVRMPLLMFICGLLTSRSSKVFERVVQLGWIFIVWSTILHVAEVAFKGNASSWASFVSQLVYPTTAMWFVWAIAGMTVSLPLLRKIPLVSLAVAAGLSMLNDAVQPFAGEPMAYRQTLSHAVFFYVGALYGSKLVAWADSQGRSIFWLVPVLAALRLFDHFTVQSLGWQVLGLAERVVAICLALYLAAQLHRLPMIGVKLVQVGQNTLPLYVGHWLFVYVGVQLFGHLVPVSLALAFITAFALAGSIALHRASMVLGANCLYKVPDVVLLSMRNLLTSGISAGKLKDQNEVNARGT